MLAGIGLMAGVAVGIVSLWVQGSINKRLFI